MTAVHEFRGRQGSITLWGDCPVSPDEFNRAAQRLEDGTVTTLDHLPGAYTALVQRGEITEVTPDPSGQFPIYWTVSPDGVQIASFARALPERPLNTTYLASNIVLPLVSELRRGETAFQGIQRIEADQRAYFPSGAARPDVYEQPVELHHDRTLGEAAEALRHTFIRSMTARLALEQAVTTDCSGGLDSTTIALVWAELSGQPLDAFVFFDPFGTTADLQYARMATEHTQIHLHELREESDTLPFQAMELASMGDEPDPAVTIAARIHQRLHAARMTGSLLHLTGDGGDEVLDGSFSYLADLARNKQEERLQHDGRIWARLGRTSPALVIEAARRQAEITLPQALQTLATYIHAHNDDSQRVESSAWLTWSNEAFGWLQPAIRQELAERAHQASAQPPNTDGMGMADYIARRNVRASGSLHGHLRHTAARLGIKTAAPFLDNDAVNACLGVPATERANPRAFKSLLKLAFPGTLPPVLHDRASKGDYTSAYYRGLRRARNNLEQLLQDSHLADLGIIEPRAVRADMHHLDMGLAGPFAIFSRLVAAELWLRQVNNA